MFGDFFSVVSNAPLPLLRTHASNHTQGKFPGDLRVGRWPSVSTLSSSSATTDCEMSDDSLSVDADTTPDNGSPSSSPGSGNDESFKAAAAAAATATVKTEDLLTTTTTANATKGGVGENAGGVSCPSPAATVKSGIDQEMGELSELFAPDAFLLGTVLDTEMEAAGAGGVRAAAAGIEMAIEPTVTEPKKSVVVKSAPPPATGGGGEALKTAAIPQAAVVQVAGTVTAAAAPAVKAEYLPATAAAVSSSLAPTTAAAAAATASANSSAAATAAAAAPAAATAVAATAVATKEECRCGETGCNSLLSGARKRPMVEFPSSSSSSSTGSSSTAASGGMDGASGTPLSMVTGLPYASLHQSSRQRKRQRSLTPVLSAPRTVSYECSLCKESYPSEIASNPWWSLFLHECPRCHRMQIPRVDATSAAVSVDYIHAVCAEEGEGCDSDGLVSQWA